MQAKMMDMMQNVIDLGEDWCFGTSIKMHCIHKFPCIITRKNIRSSSNSISTTLCVQRVMKLDLELLLDIFQLDV